ncbi:MAG: hypothetical protein FJ222_11335 [Lentisphaerae bacterium]|nr:hypothetical protein [Lentisphaerota bacterium]
MPIHRINTYFRFIRLGVCVLLPVLFLGAPSVRAEPLDLVTPSAGLHWNGLTVSPFAEVLYFYDSNYDRVDQGAESNHGPSLRSGFDFSYGGNRHKWSGQFWYQWEKYMGEGRLDSNQWREKIGYLYETPQGTVLRVDHYWGEIYQSDFERGLWQDRREFALNAGIAHVLTPKTRIQLDLGSEDVKYLNPALYDWRQYSADLSVARVLTPKSDVFVGVGTALEESESSSGFSKSYRVNMGLASRATEKVSYRIAVGGEAFDPTGSNESMTLAPYYQLGATWRASRKWSWSASGQGQHQNSEEMAGNYGVVYTLGLGSTYQPNRRVSVATKALWRCDINEIQVVDPATGNLTDRVDNEFGIRTDLNYRLSKYASLRLGGEAMTQISTISQNEYKRFRVDMGLNFRY